MVILLFYFNNISLRLSDKKIVKGTSIGIEPVLCRTDNTVITCKPSHPVGSYEENYSGQYHT